MNEKIKNEIKKKILNFLPTIKKNNNLDNIDQALFMTAFSKTLIIKILTQSEMDIFNSQVIFLLFLNKNFNKHDKGFITNKLIELYKNILTDESKLDMFFEDFFLIIFNNSLDTYFVISELENILIQENVPYELVNSTIKIITKKEFAFLNEIVIFKDIFNKPCIFTKVNAGDPEKAKELALKNFIISLNLLKLYFPYFYPVLKGNTFCGKQELLLYNETHQSSHFNMKHIGKINFSQKVDLNFYNYMIKEGINNLKKENEISKIIKDCLYWFNLGLDADSSSVRLIFFVTVFEAILKKSNEKNEISKTVSERGALFLRKGLNDRKEISKQFKKIYETRSVVLHTGFFIKEKDVENVFLAEKYAREIIQLLIKRSNEFDGDFGKFIDYLDDLKFR